MKLSPEQLARLSPAKRALLEKRLSGDLKVAAAPVLARQHASSAPLTRRQEGIWISERLAGPGPLWNLTDALKVSGPLSEEWLRQSIAVCFRRHDTLRSRVTEGPNPQFEVVAAELHFDVVDFSDQPRATAERDAYAHASACARVSIDMHRAPLYRITLIRIAREEHLLAFVLHHIGGDGWSFGVVVGEIQRVYAALAAGAAPQLPPLPVQYSDYALWSAAQHSTHGPEWQAKLGQLREQLAGAPPLVTFPADFPRPALLPVQGHLHRSRIPAATASAVSQLARSLGISSFTALLAAFKVLLARYSGQREVLVGSSSANRQLREVEPLIGMFVNTVVYRTDLHDDPSFNDLARRVHETGLKILATQAIAFEDLLAALDLRRDPSFQPVFQVMFIFQNWPLAAQTLGDASLSRVGIHSGTAKHDLHFVLEERDGQLEVSIEYNTALYLEATIEQLAQNYRVLLDSIVANPTGPMSALPLLSEQQRERICRQFNATGRDYPRQHCLHELIEQQALRTPEAIAVVDESGALSYAELERRSNQLAHLLRNAGVAPNVIVGLCVERSAQMVVALLAILKAGGAYLPLDPGYPLERLRYMLADSKAPVLITERALLHALPSNQAEVLVLVLEDCAASCDSQPTISPVNATGTADLAYVIYTSGSTGRPKGVMVSHGSVVNFLSSMAVEPGLTHCDSVAATTALSFDIAGLELYLPLLCGARVVVVPRATVIDTQRLSQLLDRSQISVAQATPSMWRMLLDTGWRPSAGLKVLTGGEALPEDVAAVLATAPGGAWNMYGPTETTIWSTVQRLQPNTPIGIGRPIANTTVFVLDASMQPVPIGVGGELYIGGEGLARGYLHQPALSAERFVRSPFAADQQLYRTGDLVRWRHDGTLEFLGRIDQQIKLRGHRIELGEIEAALLELPQVERAVVVARQDQPGELRLVAYVVSSSAALDPLELRRELRHKLPEYMIPAAVVRLERLPMTPNGKIDRNGLPQPDAGQGARDVLTARRAVPFESEVAALWVEALRREPIGIDDNFFELGGHSLVLMRIHTRLCASLNRQFPVTVMLQHPTIRSLAEYLAGSGSSTQAVDAGQARAALRRQRMQGRSTEGSGQHV